MGLGQMEFNSAMSERSGTLYSKTAIPFHGYPDLGAKTKKNFNQFAEIESRATLLYKAGEAPPALS